MKILNTREVQLRLLEMAIAVRDILELHHIPYFITYGTLLGAVRHHGFIPWDDDFDIYIFDESYDGAIEILRTSLPKDCFLEDDKSEEKYFHAWAHVKDEHTIAECEQFPQDGQYLHKGISLDLYRAYQIPANQLMCFKHKMHLEYLERRKAVGLIEENDFAIRYAKVTSNYKAECELTTNNVDKHNIYSFVDPYNGYFECQELLPLRYY